MQRKTMVQIALRDLKYGYFAPLQALWLMGTRPGGFGRHLKGLYRLAFGR